MLIPGLRSAGLPSGLGYRVPFLIRWRSRAKHIGAAPPAELHGVNTLMMQQVLARPHWASG